MKQLLIIEAGVDPYEKKVARRYSEVLNPGAHGFHLNDTFERYKHTAETMHWTYLLVSLYEEDKHGNFIKKGEKELSKLKPKPRVINPPSPPPFKPIWAKSNIKYD